MRTSTKIITAVLGAILIVGGVIVAMRRSNPSGSPVGSSATGTPGAAVGEGASGTSGGVAAEPEAPATPIVVPPLPSPLCPDVPAIAPPIGFARSIPVFLYHGEGNEEGQTPLSVFVDQMCALKADGWRTITMAQLKAFMKNGAKLPDKSFMLTFDDGRKDTFGPVDPVLKQLGDTAVMFDITGFSMPDDPSSVPANFYLSKDELRTMAESGRWDLESHGKEDHRMYDIRTSSGATAKGHFLSNLFWLPKAGRLETADEFTTRITNDLTLSKQTLEKDFGQSVIGYAYPFNDFGQDTLNFPDAQAIIARVVPSIYTFAFYQTWPSHGDAFNYADPSQIMIKRFEPGTLGSGKALLDILDASRVKDLPYRSSSFGQEWVGTWGTIQSNGTLSLSAPSTTNGAEAALNGAQLWKDYSFTANVDWIAGTDVSLVARRQDGATFLACDFSDAQATLERHVQDAQTNIATAPYAFSGSKSDATFRMDVKGATASCYANGKLVVSGKATEPVFRTGGIALRVWNQEAGIANMRVKSVSVSGL